MKKDDWSHLDSPVQGCTGKGVGVLRVEDHLHDIVGVTLKHLRASPALHKSIIMKMLMLDTSARGTSTLIQPHTAL